jgi:quercetin dioxygenase-like cupin family protein
MAQTRPFVVHEQDCDLERWDEPADGRVAWRTLLSADRTPSASLTMGVAELEPGEAKDLRLHKHAQAEAYYILSGEGTVTVSGTQHPVRAGSAIFIPGGEVHGALNTGAEPLRLLYVFPADSFAEIEYEFED